MKKSLFIALCLATAISAQARNWTNSNGKTVEADFVRVEGDKVFLKVLKTRRTHSFEISKLSEEDQDYIATRQEELAEEAKANRMANRKASWHVELQDAEKESKDLDMPMLVLITAPKVHPGCELLEKDVLKKKEFKSFANENLVLHMVDFSEKSVLTNWKKKNPEMAKKCEGFGIPRVFFIGVNGEVLGSLGYKKVSAKEYVGLIQDIIK